MLRRKPPEPPRPPDPSRTIWTNLFGEAMGGTVMLILGGVAWLAVSLPAQLNEIKAGQKMTLESIERIAEVQEKHEAWLRDHERRLVREEVLSREGK